jgi:hypothetical protein
VRERFFINLYSFNNNQQWGDDLDAFVSEKGEKNLVRSFVACIIALSNGSRQEPGGI